MSEQFKHPLNHEVIATPSTIISLNRDSLTPLCQRFPEEWQEVICNVTRPNSPLRSSTLICHPETNHTPFCMEGCITFRPNEQYEELAVLSQVATELESQQKHVHQEEWGIWIDTPGERVVSIVIEASDDQVNQNAWVELIPHPHAPIYKEYSFTYYDPERQARQRMQCLNEGVASWATVHNTLTAYLSPGDLHTLTIQPTSSPEILHHVTSHTPEPEIVAMDEVVGYDQLKARLLRSAYKTPGAVLVGQSGVGKTHLARSLASEREAKLVTIDTERVASKDPRQAMQEIKTLFESITVDNQSRALLLLDDFDQSDPPMLPMIKNMLLRYLRIASSSPHIFTLITTPEATQATALSSQLRFLTLEMPLPDKKDRRALLAQALGRLGADTLYQDQTGGVMVHSHLASELSMLALIDASDGLVGADFRRFVTKVRQNRMGHYEKRGAIPILTGEQIRVLLSSKRER